MTTNTAYPSYPPHMATLDQENEWMVGWNDYQRTMASEAGFRFFIRVGRAGGPQGAFRWVIKEVDTDRPVEMFEDRGEAFKALDAMEVN